MDTASSQPVDAESSTSSPAGNRSEAEIQHLRLELARIEENRAILEQIRDLNEREAEIRARLHEMGDRLSFTTHILATSSRQLLV